ncbi:LOW QUALITY PROTEIN: protein OSCP1 [Colletes gigas]|uniref:LOW QUALITY PROTEIN: protein OSCP1 n=1 Tax=Colletes gigas TaxID=935657 RepID=UPI001C9A427C|nr:LOW QUALITY PROTEIN: protein OSCP1 [Colletes gigas]
MSLYATPILYLNMGGEMLYVLRQRLKAQKINVDKTIQVLDDVTAALLNPKILSSIFVEKPLIEMSILRSTLECVVLSSLVKLDINSMNKLFDLMIMMVKYQLTAATGPKEVILLTLNHTDAMRDMVNNSNAQECVGLVHQMVVDFYNHLTCEEVWNARNDCLKVLEPYCVKVSLLLSLGLQNDNGSFNLMHHKYDEKYEENKSCFSDIKLCDLDSKNYCDGTFNLFDERGTLLGKNMYSMTHEMSKLILNTEKENHDLKDCGAKAELGMLAVQLGTEETSYKRPFTLNLLSNDTYDNADTVKEGLDSKEDNKNDTVVTKYEKTVFNEEYKTKLDNVRADFSEDKLKELEYQMLILDILEGTE